MANVSNHSEQKIAIQEHIFICKGKEVSICGKDLTVEKIERLVKATHLFMNSQRGSKPKDIQLARAEFQKLCTELNAQVKFSNNNA